MGLFLSNAELVDLTGYKLANKQVHWLKCHGYYVESNARGTPRITYAQIEEMRRNNMPANVLAFNRLPDNSHPNISINAEPDFNGLRKKISKGSVSG